MCYCISPSHTHVLVTVPSTPAPELPYRVHEVVSGRGPRSSAVQNIHSEHTSLEYILELRTSYVITNIHRYISDIIVWETGL